jgi:hypothetical protein
MQSWSTVHNSREDHPQDEDRQDSEITASHGVAQASVRFASADLDVPPGD